MIQLFQRALVQVGSTSQGINIEWRKIAWRRINIGMKSLAKESYDNRNDNLFGPGLLEKASKKVEADKALAKVVHDGSNSRKRSFEDDPKDLCHFLSKGASAQYGSKGKHGSKGKQHQYKPTPRKVSFNTRSQSQLTTNRNRDSSASSIISQTTQSYFISRESLQLPRQLEMDNIRSLDPTDSTGRYKHWTGLLDWHILVFNFIFYILWYRVVLFY